MNKRLAANLILTGVGLVLLGSTFLLRVRAAMAQASPSSGAKVFAIASNNPEETQIRVYLPLIRQNGTITCGEIITDTIWTASAGPYRITCDVIVPSGVTLAIEPGVMAQFAHSDADLIISGTLQAVGTQYAPIRFQPASGATRGSWGRVAFMPGSSGVMDHAILESGGSSEGLVYIASDMVQVMNSVVQYSANTGIIIQAASPLISGTQILTNTAPAKGGGLYNDSGNPIIRNNTFINNSALYGGGLGNGDGSPTILDNTFSDNRSSAGGGLYNATGSPIIQNNTLTDNHMAFGGGTGGGLYNESGNPQILNNVFSFNSDSGLINISGNPIIQNNIFTNNGAYPGGGGGLSNISGNPIIQNNIITGNGAYVGGGIYNDSGKPIIQNNTFTDNYARGSGGGLYNQSGSFTILNNTFTNNHASFGGGLYNKTGSLIIKNNTFSHNFTYDVNGNGGGLYNASGNPEILNNIISDNSGSGLFNASGSPLVQNNTFINNSAYAGGGLYNSTGYPIIQNNTFYSNTASSGGALFILEGGPILNSNIVANNTADYGGGIVSNIDAGPTLDYNDVWNNAGGNYEIVAPGSHDISADPLLVDPANGDFHLAPGSPCIDAGDPVNYPPTDFEGDPRPMGAAPDIGADEFRSPILNFLSSFPLLPRLIY